MKWTICIIERVICISQIFVFLSSNIIQNVVYAFKMCIVKIQQGHYYILYMKRFLIFYTKLFVNRCCHGVGNYLSKKICLKSAFIALITLLLGWVRSSRKKKPLFKQLEFIRTLNIVNKMINKPEKLPTTSL